MDLIFSDITEEAISSLRGSSGLISRNVRIKDKRTSIRLESDMWQALHEIASMENCSIHDVCTAVYEKKEAGASFTAALRVFLMLYYRTMAMADFRVSGIRKTLQG